ncbi:MAG TPA: ATP-binding protein [Planctomycetota bacterium]
MTELLYFLASIGNLFLALFVIFRARRARGALPIALLCLSLFVWDIAEAAKSPSGTSYWHYIRLVGSSLAPAFLWHFVAVFTQRERRLRRWTIGLYVATAVFTLMTAGALVSVRLREAVDGAAWNIAYLIVFFPFFLASLEVVRRRRGEVETPVERNALMFVAAGIAAGAFTGFTELVHILKPAIPRLGYIGSALCAMLLAISILRHRLLAEQTPVRKVLLLFMLALSAAVALAASRNAYLVGGVAMGVAALALYRLLFVRLYEQAERRQRLALIGTMAAGVAHEIKNPLAAIKGAAQYVQKELESAAFRGESVDYLKLLVGEVDRLNAVVESFLTYARPLEPRRQDVDLPAFLTDILRLQAASFPAQVKLETAFDPELPPVPADPALVTIAVVNVVRNALEVMPEGGTLTVRARPILTALRAYASIEISDTGPGVPKEDLERIFQPFYTTKAKGTGLGLAIAQRVIEAHGGEVQVDNVLPKGCRFTFLLPLPVL